MSICSRIKISIICLCLASFNAFAQTAPNWIWANSFGEIDDERSNTITTDEWGNSIIAGKFDSQTLNFGNIVLNNFGGDDCFIAKFDQVGTVLWAKSYGGDYDEEPFALTTDASGNSIVVGYFSSDSLVCDSITLINSGFSYEAFIIKYDPSGNVIWAKKTNGISNEVALGVATDNLNNVIVTGWFDDAVVNFDAYSLTNYAPGSSDMFLLKLDSLGNVLWAISEGNEGTDGGHPVDVDIYGNIAVVVYFTSDTLVISNSTIINLGNFDHCLVKYSPNGTPLWAKSIAGTDDDFSISISIDNANNYIVYGRYYSPNLYVDTITLVNTDSLGTSDIFIIKIDSLSNILWTKSIGGNGFDIATVMDINNNNDLIIGGYFGSESIAFDTITINNSDPFGNGDIFLAKYDASGNAFWAISDGISGFNERLNALSVNNNDDIFITGWYFGPYFTLGNDSLYNLGSTDLFLGRLSNCAIASIDSIYACDFYTWIDGNNYSTSNSTATYTLTNTEGCDSVITLNLTIGNQNTSIIFNNGVLSSSNSGSSYQWLDCNNNFAPISGEINQTFSPTSSGSYSIVVNSNSCIDTSGCFTFNTVALETNSTLSYTFPNPVIDFIYFYNVRNLCTINIFDAQGKTILNKQLDNYKLSVEGLASGLYFYSFYSLNDNLEIKGKFIKE